MGSEWIVKIWLNFRFVIEEFLLRTQSWKRIQKQIINKTSFK